MDVIPASALLYVINFATCYKNGPQKARKLIFGEYTGRIIGVSGKLRILCNPFYYEKVRSGVLWEFRNAL
jgi:hypothetical protein